MDKGGFWRYLAFLVAYLVIYLGSSLAGKLFPDQAEADSAEQRRLGVRPGDPAPWSWAPSCSSGCRTTSAGTVPCSVASRSTSPGGCGCGRAVALVPVLLRVAGIDWGGPSFSVVVTVLLSGLLVGVVEELMYRGFAVKMIRAGGHGELAVAALSSGGVRPLAQRQPDRRTGRRHGCVRRSCTRSGSGRSCTSPFA